MSIKVEDEFIPVLVVRNPRQVPWGYDFNPQERTATADYQQLKYLSEAFDRLDSGESLRSVSEWLTEESKESLSSPGLLKSWKRYRPDSPINKQRAKLKKIKARKKPRIVNKTNKERRTLQHKMAAEKRRITGAKKRLEALQGSVQEKTKAEEELKTFYKNSIISAPETPEAKEALESSDRPVIFKPNDGPQTEFLAASELEILYGGSAGGGKSYGLIADPMRYFDRKHFSGILFRRTNDELREIKWKTKELYPKVFPDAKWSEKESEWRFKNGSRLWLTYLDKDDDVLRYQGQAFTWIGFDELTHWPTAYPWGYMRSRLRTSKGSDILSTEMAMRSTSNPGGPGHGWVKSMFIDPAPFNEPFWATDINTGETLTDPDTGQPLFRRRFIPAKLDDNPYIAEDGQYRKNLLAMEERRRKQLLDGDWTVAEGAAFQEFKHSIHVVPTEAIDPRWSRFRAMDYGYSAPSAVLWFAINPETEQLVCYREYYKNKRSPEQIAYSVLTAEQGERIMYGSLDSSVWHTRERGPTPAERMNGLGCRWRKADRSPGSRIAGKARIHELLRINDTTGEPGLVFQDNCRQIIKDLPVIPMDPKGGEDIDQRYPSDHTYDALRYGVQSRPRSDPFEFIPAYQQSTIADTVFGY